jgi:hypothetical protein
MLLDGLILQRLGEGRLVALVVAVAAVADQVDQEILLEAGAVGVGQPGHLDAGGRVVGIDVDDGNLEALGQVAGVERAAALRGRGGEAKLIVGDDVQGAAGAPAGQERKVEGLGDHALAGEGQVAVDDERQSAVGIELDRPGSVTRVPAARAMPSTTGLTDSRWLGLGAR